MNEHIPVLLNEVIEYLNPQPNQNFVDFTFGFGGHTQAILEKTKPNGRVLGIEWDKEKTNNKELITNNKERLKIVNDSYANLKNIVEKEKFGPINGILLDLGISSWEVDNSGRGFSFKRNEPLDMRYCASSVLTAQNIVNDWSKEEIERILREYGEERFAARISNEIVKLRKIEKILTTQELVRVLARAIPEKYKHGRTNFATRTFQALRLAVNDELGNLEKFLPQTRDLLADGGRLVVISFHSLEDRIVKNFFRLNAQNGHFLLLTKKPLQASFDEIAKNPRSRSAKLRAAQKTIL